MTTAFRDKAAIVTGGASGLRAEIARRLGAEGTPIVFTGDVNEVAASEVADEIQKGGGTAAAIRQDVGDAASVKKSVDFAQNRFGGLHFLCRMFDFKIARPEVNIRQIDDFLRRFQLAQADPPFRALRAPCYKGQAG